MSYKVKGYANSVAAIDPDDPNRSCGYQSIWTDEGNHSVNTSKMLSASNTNCSSLMNVICGLVNLALKIPGVGSVLKPIVSFMGC